MDGRHTTLVAGIHSLEHIECLGRATLSYHDSVWPHSQAVDHKVLNRDLTSTFDVGRAGLECYHVFLSQLQLGCVLDGENPLIIGDKARQDVEKRRLARASAARDKHVEFRVHAGLHQFHRPGRHTAQFDQSLDGW